MAPSPVILQMEVHCHDCARKIRRAVKHVHGVENVWASPGTGLVVISGWADALALKRQIESRIRKLVVVLCDDTEESPCRRWPQQSYPPFSFVENGMLLPPPPAYYYAPYSGGWWQ